MAHRKRRTTKQRLAIFEHHGGVCHLCGLKIDGVREPWELEHKIALTCGGTDDDENLAPAHVECHKPKTREDKRIGAKCDRIRAKHLGAKRPKGWWKPPGAKYDWNRGGYKIERDLSDE